MKRLNIFALFIAVMMISGLYGLFDFERLEFENVGLALIYAIVFAASLFMLIRGMMKKE